MTGEVNGLSEKTIPVHRRWIIQNGVERFGFPFAIAICISSLPGVSNFFRISMSGIAALMIIGLTIMGAWSRKRFHFSVEDNSLVVSVGAPWQRSQSLKYTDIRRVLVKRGVLDWLFGLFTVVIEVNHSMGVAPIQSPIIGILGNKLVIPGLTRADAVLLKETVIKHMSRFTCSHPK